MKKRIYKLPILLIATLPLFGCQGNEKEEEKVIKPTDETVHHEISGTLHNVKVTENASRVLAENGSSDYRIIYEKNNEYAAKAASFIANKFLQATSANIKCNELSDDDSFSSSAHLIVLGCQKLRDEAGVADSSENLFLTGYQFDTKGDSAFIRVKENGGYQQAAISFLRYVLGYNRYSEDIITFDKVKDGRVTLPDLEVAERPDFAYRTQSNKVDTDYSYETGFLNSTEVFLSDNEIDAFHNSFNWLSPDTYKEAHPKWYNSARTQICYTAHGDEEEYAAMVEEASSKMIAKLAANQSVGAITFSIQDNYDSCDCEACEQDIEKYGAASGSVIKFCNALDDKIQAYLQEDADKNETKKRELNLVFFAYHKTESPCAKLNEQGQYVPTSPDIICNEHVGPYIAPIRACYTKSFYHEDNASYANAIKGWGALSNKLYIWLYETNFNHYLYPLNTYSTMIETYRFCIENNAQYMYNEGQHNNGAVTCFGRFKEYFNSVAEFDVNSDYQQIVNDFFANYFGPASSFMLSYFQELQDQFAYIQNTYATDINGTIYNNISQSRFWPKALLDRWVNYMNEAQEAIEVLRENNRALYETISNNIILESIFPRYALLEHHSGKYSAMALEEARSSFREDCLKVNVTKANENTTMESIYASWGL